MSEQVYDEDGDPMVYIDALDGTPLDLGEWKVVSVFTSADLEFLGSFNYPHERLPEPNKEQAVRLWRIGQRLVEDYGLPMKVFLDMHHRANAGNCWVCGDRDNPGCIQGC